MDDSSRMMHFPQGFGMGLGEHQQPTSPQSQQHPGSQEGQGEVGGVQDGVVGHASINTILDQIMTITDQSIDEVLNRLEDLQENFNFMILVLFRHARTVSIVTE